MKLKNKMKDRNLKLIFMSIFVVLILILLFSIFYLNLNKTESLVLLGFCPTMKDEANLLYLNNNNIVLKEYLNTNDVIDDLNLGNIDIGLVGRVVKVEELKENFYELRLKNGFTLISYEKKGIYYNDLNKIQIHTYLSKDEVNIFLGSSENVLFYEEFDLALENRFFSGVLIDWDDYNESYELLIPVDENNFKIKKFRIPVLYSYTNLNNLKLI